MMNWRERRKLSYLMHDFDDINLPHEIKSMTDNQLVNTVVHFFETKSSLIYPAKSYFVAIVYAGLLERYFHIPFLKALSLDDLLPDDKWYVPYWKNSVVYDKILCKVPKDFLSLPSTIKTTNYFKEEFLIGTDCESNKQV